MSWFEEFREAFSEDALRGPDDQAKQFYAARDLQNLDDDAIRLEKYFAEHPVIYRTQEMLGDPKKNETLGYQMQARREMGMGAKQSMAGKLGQLGGALSYDLMHDKSRNLYWLLNAAQASGSVINELAMNSVNPDLFGTRAVRFPNGSEVKYNDKSTLSQMTSPLDGQPMAKDVSKEKEPTKLASSPDIKRGRNKEARLRNYRSGTVTALGIPAGFAINQGLGLMTPFGGYEGYEAVIPSEGDASKSANVIGEVAAKYIMGRTGNLLPYDEFVKVRPDVSKGEYNAYKAFKYDKDGDLNPFDDGQVTLPTGVIKATTDGIHGAELQFLGRSLPVNTALIPFAGAVGGAMMGVRKRDTFKEGGAEFAKGNDVDRRAGRRGVIGGVLGTAAGMTVGNLLEGERRRRNQAQNESYNQL